MEWIFGGVALLIVGGVVLAVYERRKGIKIIDERGGDPGISGDAQRDIERATDIFRNH